MTKTPISGIVKDLQGLLSDDGSALDRMNAGKAATSTRNGLGTLPNA
jgi:hypothetical protein